MTLGLAIAIAVGGALGALLRYGAQLLWSARGAHVPIAVLLVNVVGSATAGAFLALSQADVVDPAVALIVMTGFCGGLTTFSTFAVETVELATGSSWRPAAANIVLNLVLGLGAAAFAFAITTGVILTTSSAFVG